MRALLLVTIAGLSGALTITTPAAAATTKDFGVNLRGSSKGQLATTATRQSMFNAKSAGVNTVTLVYPHCQANAGSSVMYDCPTTPSDQTLRTAIRNARGLGLKVAVTVHQQATSGTWSGYFCPTDRTAWFVNYRAMLVRLGSLLQSEHVQEFIIGGEMPCLTMDSRSAGSTSRWRELIRATRSVYTAQLSYSAQRESSYAPLSELDHIAFWDALTFIGSSAYYPLSDAGSVTKLRQQWDHIEATSYAPLVARWHRKVLITEVGYRSITGASVAPYDYRMTGPLDLGEQARAYTALLGMVHDSSIIAGVHLWEWSADPNAGGPQDKTYTPQRKPAQAVMKRLMVQA